MVRLYSRPLALTYHANRWSCASCCTFLYVIVCVVLPYVAVYALGGMWAKEVPMREQPLIIPRYEVLVEAHASSPGAPVVPLLWSSSTPLNDAIGASLRPSQLRSWVEDDQQDGVPDRLHYVLTMPIDANAGERLHSVSVLIGAGVRFETEFNQRFNASLLFQASSPLPGKAMAITADLALRSSLPQRSLDLPPRAPCPEPVWAFRQPVLPDGSPASAASILAQYAPCNDSIVLSTQPPLWTPGVADAFEAHVTLRVPAIETTRKPGLIETLKLAAVQYIAFCIPIGLLVSYLHGALFRFGVVAARVHHPVKQHTW